MKLNQKNIAGLEPPNAGQVLYWDDQLKGFGLRVTPGCKTFVVQNRVKGENRRITVGRYGTITAEEARLKAKRLLGDMADGIDPNKAKAAERMKNITLGELFDEYMQHKKLEEKTVEIYVGAFDRCLKEWRKKQITSITGQMVLRHFDKLCNRKGPRTGSGHAQAAQGMRLLGSLFNYSRFAHRTADGKPLVVENPVEWLSHSRRGWSKTERRERVLHEHELPIFYQGLVRLRNQTAKDYLLFVALTGLRREEAIALRWNEIDLDARSLIIPGERTKNDQPHGLPLTKFVHAMLSRRWATNVTGSAYVFPGTGRTGHYTEPSSAIESISALLDKPFCVHDLRRTFETIAASRVKPGDYVLKRLLNHFNKSDVTGRYIVIDIEQLRQPLAEINDVLLDLMKVPKLAVADNVRPMKRRTRNSLRHL